MRGSGSWTLERSTISTLQSSKNSLIPQCQDNASYAHGVRTSLVTKCATSLSPDKAAGCRTNNRILPFASGQYRNLLAPCSSFSTAATDIADGNEALFLLRFPNSVLTLGSDGLGGGDELSEAGNCGRASASESVRSMIMCSFILLRLATSAALQHGVRNLECHEFDLV